MTWFLSDPGRLAAERAAVEALETEADWLAGTRWHLEGAGLSLDAVLRVHGRDWPLRLRYPALFPAAPIAACPQEAGERWSGHQYGDGALCLEWGPDNWHPGVTGRQMLESAYRLLSAEGPTDPADRQVAPSRHHLTAGQALRGRRWRVYVGRALQERLTRPPAPAWVDFSLHFQSTSVLVVLQTVRGGGEAWESPDVPRTLRKDADSVLLESAAVRRVPVALADAALTTVAALDILLGEHGQPPAGEARAGNGRPASVLLLDGTDTPHFYYRFEDGAELYPVALVRPGGEGAEGRLPAECQALAGKAVGIVGLGSVGSKLALSLARSGVGRFVLVDEDVFLPENVVRHALDLHNTAEHKADALADAIERVAPGVSVLAERIHLTGQESNAAVNGVLRNLGRCDLLVDATADPRLFGLLAAAAGAAEKPMLWMEVFAGGIGGLIARSRPGRGPSPATMRRALHQFTAEHPAEELAEAGPYAAEAHGRVVTATDGDVSVIAGLAAQLAIDALAEREPSAYPHAMYLVGFRRAWVFEAPLHVLPLDTSHLADPDQPAADEQTVTAGLEFLRSLLGEAEQCE